MTLRHSNQFRTRRWQALALALAFFMLSGCVTITQPTNNSTVSNPVTASIGFRSQYCANFNVTLDGADVTGQFSPQPPAAALPTATFNNLLPGAHTLVASADTTQYWFLFPYCASGSDSVTFTIPGPSFSLSASPNPLTVTRGGSNTLTVSVTRGGGFSGSVTVNMPANFPNGITASPTSQQIPAAGSSATFPITAATTVVLGQSLLTVSGNAAGVAPQQTPFTLNVVAPAPTISAVSPTSQIRGGTVTITGTGFDPACGNNTVTIAGANTPTPTACSTTSLTALVPQAAASGSTTLKVTTNSLVSNPLSFAVLPSEVVVAGGPNNANFAVMDFTNPNNPHIVNPPSGFSGGTAVDCSGSTVAVGNLNGGQVVLFDISNPASPTKLGNTINTGLSGIGAIKFDGSNVLVGEMNGSRVVLINASNPASPQVGSPFPTGVSSIGSIGMSGARAVIGGPNTFTMDILNFSNPAQPTRTSFNPNIGGGLTVDLDGTMAAVGSQNGTQVAFVNILTPATTGLAPQSGLSGINSVSVKGALVAAGSNNSFNMALISFGNPSNPAVGSVNPNLGGGWTVALNPNGNRLAGGNVTGSNVALFAVSGTSATLLKNQNSGISSIGSVCVTDF